MKNNDTLHFFRSKYFRGKRIHIDYDIRVEQAEFKELSVNSNSESGVTASIILAKSGNKVVRSFKPDFLLGMVILYMEFHDYLYTSMVTVVEFNSVDLKTILLMLYDANLLCKHLDFICNVSNKGSDVLCT